MRILIIDDSKRRVQIVHKFLAKEVPELEAAHYSPEQQGKPGQSFDWSRFDALLLDDDLSGGQSGLQWLDEFAHKPGFPPTVLITSKTDNSVTTKALNLGARGVISKRDLTPTSLAEAVRKAVAEQESSDNLSGAGRRGANDADIVAQSRKGDGGGACDYKFVRLIGQGAMSRVYLAERVDDKVTVVLKIMDGSLSNDPESVTRFIQEASLVSQMRSPYVVKIFEQGFTNKYGFIAMEFFARGDLRQRIDPPDRDIYGFFHPTLGDEPLIFVEVALMEKTPSSIDEILTDERTIVAGDSARTAVFYSISNCQRGLRGIPLGSFLIKQVVESLQRSQPGLKDFVTLSPVPCCSPQACMTSGVGFSNPLCNIMYRFIFRSPLVEYHRRTTRPRCAA